jgi:hypothetical protein
MGHGTTSVRALGILLALGLAAGGAAAQVENGSFETGDFSGWETTDLSLPLNTLEVVPLGAVGYFGIGTQPTEGDFSAFHGFDGNGPGDISIAQDLVVPATAPLLLLDYLAIWDMIDIASNATLDRTFRVSIGPEGGGAELASIEVLRAEALTKSLGTERVTAAVDLSDFAGDAVRLGLIWTVPEDYTGPAHFDFDNLRLVGKKLPVLDKASLKLGLDFTQAGHDTLKVDLAVPVGKGFEPEGQELTITVGDVEKVFLLDGKGAAQSGGDKLSLAPVGGQAGHRRVKLSSKQGDFAAALAAYGLLDDDTPKAGNTVVVPVSVELDGTTTERSLAAVYKATAGKSGKASGKAASEAWSTKLDVRLDLALADEDSISLKTTALTGAGFAPNGEEVIVDIGGVRKTLTLGPDGKAEDGENSIALKRDPKTPTRQLVTLKCDHGNFGDVSEDFFLFKGDTPPGGLDVIVPVSVTLDGRITKSIVPVNYKATAGKSGKAKS